MKMLSQVHGTNAATSVPREVAPSPLEKLREFIETHRMKAKMGPGRSRISSVTSTPG